MTDELDIQVPIKAQQKRTKIKEAVALDNDAMVLVMSSKEGRRTVWRIMETTGYFLTSFTGNSETFFREGKRYIGRLLYDELNELCPDLYNQMVSENRKKKEPRND